MSKFVWEEGDAVLTPAPPPTEEEANTALPNPEFDEVSAELARVTAALDAAGWDEEDDADAV
jgi:hypothetical protein